MVSEVQISHVPYTVCKMVAENCSETYKVRTCKMVPEEQVSHIPYTVCRLEREEQIRQVPVRTCELEPVTITRKVSRMVPFVEEIEE